MSPMVATKDGRLAGFTEDGICKFYGLPYAAPPIGDRRWRAPQPVEPWLDIRNAAAFGPACMQTVGATFDRRTSLESEDCLYLNVWTETLTPEQARPVMVWIHGGGNLGGAGSEEAFDGTRLAARGVVVVTFNYRLGAFGFLAHPDIGANFGVLDHVAALAWVRENIAAFGGDPDNVTIFGESAGAVAVRTLMSCPHAAGLFHRAIIESAGFEPPAFAAAWNYDRAKAAAERLFDRLGSHDPDTLRSVSSAELKIASHELSGIFPVPGQVHTPANLIWMPVVDGEIVVDDSFPGWAADVPVMLGCLENEARYFIKPGGNYNREGLVRMAHALAGPMADEAIAGFDRAGYDPYGALDKLFTAAIWTEPALETVHRFARMGRRFYYYHFARLSPGAIATNELAKHSAEIRYVFGNLTDDGAYDTTDRLVSDLMQQAWVSFAASGVPESPAGVGWPAYDPAQPLCAWIDDAVSVRPFPVTDIMRTLNKLRIRGEGVPEAVFDGS